RGPIIILTVPMSLMDERREQMDPRLTEAQMARIAAVGTRRRVGRGEILFEQRQVHRPFFVVLSGTIEVLQVTEEGDRPFRKIDGAHFTGEFDMLTGRPSLYRGRVVEDGEVIEVQYDQFRKLIQT